MLRLGTFFLWLLCEGGRRSETAEVMAKEDQEEREHVLHTSGYQQVNVGASKQNQIARGDLPHP